MSSIMSTAHMPRVTRRTIEPAKLLACQSVAKRCTRKKVSPAKRAISRMVRRLMPISDKWRPATRKAPSRSIIARADNAACNAWRCAALLAAIASTMRPAKTGMNRSARVAITMESAMPLTSQASRRQWRKRKASTSRITFWLFRETRIDHSPGTSGRSACGPMR